MIWLFVLLVTVVPSFVISFCTVAIVRAAAEKLGLMDKPGYRKIHVTPTPLGGGLGIWAGLIGTFALGTVAVYFGDSLFDPRGPLNTLSVHLPGLRHKVSEIWVLLLGATILMLLGLADDRTGLRWQVRLAVELIVAAGIVYWQGLQLTAFIDLPWLTGILSVIWIVTLVNSFNMLDNMDGLSGGVAAISASILAAMLILQPDPMTRSPQLFVAAMLLVLVGSLLGFLRHNWPPATIFMGDAGSYLVGYWIAIATLLTTYTGYQGTTPHAIIAPLCALAIPLYDMTSVIWIRLSEGRSPFEGDKRHFSHRLVELGLSKKSAVLTIYLATFTCGLGALLLNRTDLVGAAVVVSLVGAVLGLIAILENRPKT